MEVLPPPGGNIQAPPYFTPTPSIHSLPRTKYIWNIHTASFLRSNPKSTTTTTTKSQKKSCLLLSSEAFNSHFGLLLCVTHQIVTLQISVISAFSVFSDFSLLYLPIINLWLISSKWNWLTDGNWQKWKRVFLTCPCHEIYRDEAVGLKVAKILEKLRYLWKCEIWGNIVKIWYFVNNYLIKAWIKKKSFAHVWHI